MLNPEDLRSGEPLPSLRVEHELRYRAAAPIIAGAAVWCDLGCGTGHAATGALGDPVARALLVDRDAEAAAAAARRIPAGSAVPLEADLTSGADLARVRDSLLEVEGERVVTCFETLERLETFVPLLELLTALVADHATTIVLSVPDDEAGPVDGPRGSVWSRGAFEELRRALPGEVVAARQATLAGSVVAPVDADGRAPVELALVAELDDRARTSLLVAAGPAAPRLAPVAAVDAVDAVAERAALRRREARLAHDDLAMRELEAEVQELRARVRTLEAAGEPGTRPALDRAG